MTKKKFGKILFLSTIPHFIIWVVFAAIYKLPDHRLPHWILCWLLGILLLYVTSAYLMEQITPKETIKSIISFINE